ncbi:hypothetical protein K488DRAFT_73929 [Vararia minispora EC-137]|uniref:Uncharacterized protein n=1 Tax=Vararia minispora EC-137 TaxID=1314806 RepID=A0ACB8Q928_9AGAM|nr:hypothetical protein K488DRAFT_73929 [Vararia minispora EC-137]
MHRTNFNNVQQCTAATHSTANHTKEMHYNYHRKRVRAAHNTCNIFSTKITHVARHTSTMKYGTSEEDTKALSGWSSEPLSELKAKIFPFIEEEYAALHDRQRLGDKYKDVVLYRFLEILLYLRTVILPDSSAHETTGGRGVCALQDDLAPQNLLPGPALYLHSSRKQRSAQQLCNTVHSAPAPQTEQSHTNSLLPFNEDVTVVDSIPSYPMLPTPSTPGLPGAPTAWHLALVVYRRLTA